LKSAVRARIRSGTGFTSKTKIKTKIKTVILNGLWSL